jgi:CYTH domain-containing protein
MGTEIERKFLVNTEKWASAPKGTGELYQQGYLHTEPGKTIRVRLTDTSGFITIKGRQTGLAQPEYEYTIPRGDAQELLDLFCTAIVIKVRHKVVVEGKVWEVDEFQGHNKGLLLAEIELDTEDETFVLPDWAENEVTSDKRYSNARLVTNPYQSWNQ